MVVSPGVDATAVEVVVTAAAEAAGAALGELPFDSATAAVVVPSGVDATAVEAAVEAAVEVVVTAAVEAVVAGAVAVVLAPLASASVVDVVDVLELTGGEFD